MYFVLKSLNFFYLHYSVLHVSDTIVSIIRSFSAAHAVSGPYQLQEYMLFTNMSLCTFYITTNYLCSIYKPFFNLYVCFVLFCFRLWFCGICFLYYIIYILYYIYIIYNNIIQETNPTEPQPKTEQHKTNIKVKKRLICVTQIICSNIKCT